MHNLDLYSSVSSCSSGVELDRAQIVVVGNARGIGGRYRIGHSRDARRAGRRRDLGRDPRRRPATLPDRPHPSDLDGRLVNVFLKCEASRDGMVRGRRNAMLDDSDVHWHRQIKACVGGVAAAVTGDPAVFVSVSAAHQGPDGGGPVAAIVDLGPMNPPGRPPAAGVTVDLAAGGPPCPGRSSPPGGPTRPGAVLSTLDGVAVSAAELEERTAAAAARYRRPDSARATGCCCPARHRVE